MTFENTETILCTREGHVLHVTLNRPKARNAMSLQMVRELMATFEAVQDDLEIRAIVLRGVQGHFCAGGDIKDMANARMAQTQNLTQTKEKTQGKEEPSASEDPFYQLNREFGRMITMANQIPQVLVVVTEGAVLGGGFGLACISDLALSHKDAQFGLPETGLGIPPAQIAPFVVTRIGMTQARRLALLGARFDGEEAQRLGIVHDVYPDESSLNEALEKALKEIKRCAPEANRVTKTLMLGVGHQPLETLLDDAATHFSAAVQGPEGQEGTMAFMQKRKPSWASDE